MNSINYPLAGAIVLAAILFIAWLVRRNKKDEKKFEEGTIASETTPEKDKDELS